ncbi:hypothetical protein [Streptomyces angustmyceticus]|uniref:hypothetical protein n=1 Tax=Streptomyces angustmyceticus TaxID=285578 RepID=UPI0037FF7B3F
MTGRANTDADTDVYGSGCVPGQKLLTTSVRAAAAHTAVTAITAVTPVTTVAMVVIMAGIVVVLRTVRMGAIACHMAYRGTPNRLRLLP